MLFFDEEKGRKEIASELSSVLDFGSKRYEFDNYDEMKYDFEALKECDKKNEKTIFAQINNIEYRKNKFFVSGDLFSISLLEYDDQYFIEQEELPRPIFFFFETVISMEALRENNDFLTYHLNDLFDKEEIPETDVTTDEEKKIVFKPKNDFEELLKIKCDILCKNLTLVYVNNTVNGYKSRISFSASPFKQKMMYISFIGSTNKTVPLNLPNIMALDPNDISDELKKFTPQSLIEYNVGQGNFSELKDDKGTIVYDPGITCTKSHKDYTIATNEYRKLNADCFFISHFDTDHILGVIYLKDDQFKSPKLWIVPEPIDVSVSARRLIWFLYNTGKIRMIKSSSFKFNNNIMIYKGNADKTNTKNNAELINGSGIMIFVEGKTKTALLTGDCLYKYWNNNVPQKCDYFVVPHHGCEVDNVKMLGKNNGKSEAIIPVGKGNPYGHPDAKHISGLLNNGFNSVLETKRITKKEYDLY